MGRPFDPAQYPGKGAKGGDTRWEKFYREDPRTLSAGPTKCSRWAVSHFKRGKARIVLDLGCGRGRDSSLLASFGLKVIASDLAGSCFRKVRGKKPRYDRVPAVQADSRSLPFPDISFDGIYCFGLLHEFAGYEADESVASTMSEIQRVLRPKGLLALAVLAGDPAKGLPHVRLFDEIMLTKATADFECLAKGQCNDIGCTGRKDYRIWRGLYRKRTK